MFQSNLFCAPCRDGKMIVASHSSVNTVMTEQSGQLLHTDTVGPSMICTMGGNWYVCDVPPLSEDGQSKPVSLRGAITKVMTHNTSHTRIKYMKCSKN
jgi:hypothetical protein